MVPSHWIVKEFVPAPQRKPVVNSQSKFHSVRSEEITVRNWRKSV